MEIQMQTQQNRVYHPCCANHFQHTNNNGVKREWTDVIKITASEQAQTILVTLAWRPLILENHKQNKQCEEKMIIKYDLDYIK